jgi:hypothetical protein
MIDLNFLAILAAAFASHVLGFIWYGPLFGKLWMQLSNISNEDMERAKVKGMWKIYLQSFIGSLVMAFVLNIFIGDIGIGVGIGLVVGFLAWLGLVAPVTLGGVLWEGRSYLLWLLSNSYYLISLLIMGMILGGW